MRVEVRIVDFACQALFRRLALTPKHVRLRIQQVG
jgi:hypothetical protein